jgi:hypothetical protein
MRRIVSVLVLFASLTFVATRPVHASTGGATQENWSVVPILTATITPNFQSGYGPTGGQGTGITPAVGPLASLNGGYVDFGTVVAGYQYLYRYAALVSVTTNDTSGFKVYAEGSTDLNGSTTGTYAISNVLYWLPSSSSNSPFSAATSFQKTMGTPTNGGQNINYGGVAPPASAIVWNSPSGGSLARGYDYQIRLPGTIPIDKFNVYVVYTVIGN